MKTAALFLIAAVAFAEAPKAKSVEKKGDWDAVTLESGTKAMIYVPKTGGEAKGLVMAFHGNYSDPDGILTWAKPVADHRGEIWCALEATGKEEGLLVWDIDRDVPKVPALLEYALATYKADAKRVACFGFSMGGAAALRAYGNARARFVGVVQCAATEAPGERGDAAKGGRGVFILGTRDGNYGALGQWRPAIAKCGAGFATWIVTDLDHELPDPVYANDALAFLSGSAKGAEKTLPKKPDHAMTAADYTHAWFAWKSAKAPEGVTRTKVAAKALADQWAAKIRKGEKTASDAAAEGDGGGDADLAALEKLGARVSERAKALKPGAVEVVEGDSGYAVVVRAAR